MGQNQYDNLLLEKLPQPDRLAITSRLEEVVIPAGTVLYDAEQVPRHAWFITAGVVSKMIAMSDGRSAEVAVSGREGVIPSFQLVGNAQHGLLRCVTQTETRALRMPFPEMLREFRRSEPLRHLVLRCVQRRSMILAQIGACNRLHNTEERLARWLLTTHDLTGADSVVLSHGFLADILGARRTTVTLAVGALRRRKLIGCRRSQIQILDPEKLRGAACECYGTLRGLFQNFYG